MQLKVHKMQLKELKWNNKDTMQKVINALLVDVT